MNTKLFLIIFISAIVLIPLSDFIFNLLESNGILTKIAIGTNVLSPRKIFSFAMFLVIGFSSAGLSDDVEMLAFVHGGNAKGLGIAPAWFLADDDVG